MAAVILEINEHLSDIDDIVLLLDTINPKQIKILRSLSKINIIVRRYYPFLWTRYKNSEIKYFSPMVLCKCEGFKLLNEYKKVIWTDYDIAIKQDINELVHDYNTGLYTLDSFNRKARDNFHRDVESLNMNAKQSYCALIIFNDDIKDYNKIHKDCYKSAKKYINDLYLGEQGIFDVVIDKYKIPVDYIDPYIYSFGKKEAVSGNEKNAKILHTYCENKFWNGIYNEIYEENYAKWLAAGGKKITSRRKFLTTIMSKLCIV